MAGTNTQFAVATHIAAMLADAGGEPLSSEHIAGSVRTNPVHIRRVLGRLRRAGLVSSRPGTRGGWRLEREAGELTLGDLWRAVHDDPPVLALHDDTDPDCPVGRGIVATLGDVRARVVGAVESELDDITVEDVLRDT